MEDARELLFRELKDCDLLISHMVLREASSGHSRGFENAAVRVIERLSGTTNKENYVFRVAKSIGNEMLELNGGELDLENLEWRGYYGRNWVTFDIVPLARAAIAALRPT